MNKTSISVLLFLSAVLVFLLTPFAGMKDISLFSIFSQHPDEVATEIFWKIRIPRICLSFLAGSVLAVSGLTFQAMFLNPLATPFTLGVSSGASLGAALYIWSGASFAVLGIPGISTFAFLEHFCPFFSFTALQK